MTRKPRQLTPRICANCGHNAGVEGPRPHGSALKLVGDEIVYACSTLCRDKLGWKERV